MDLPHVNYIRAVVAALDPTFNVTSFGHWTEPPLRGAILLGVSDDWDDYQYEFASVRWDEVDGWTVEHGGLTTPLEVPLLAAPRSVLGALGLVLGPTAAMVADVHKDADECTAETLGRYAEVML